MQEKKMRLSIDEFRKKIEYSLCQQFAGDDDVREFCDKARGAGVGVACVNPVNVRLASKLLMGQGIEISGNVGFPFGSHPAEVKALETSRCVKDGAMQIDMVIQVGALRSKRDEVVFDDIRAVVLAAEGRLVKAIIETWVLNTGQIERACRIAEQAGAGLVKTTTGVRTQYLEIIGRNVRGAMLWDDFSRIDEVHTLQEIVEPIPGNVNAYKKLKPVFEYVRKCQAEIGEMLHGLEL